MRHVKLVQLGRGLSNDVRHVHRSGRNKIFLFVNCFKVIYHFDFIDKCYAFCACSPAVWIILVCCCCSKIFESSIV